MSRSQGRPDDRILWTCSRLTLGCMILLVSLPVSAGQAISGPRQYPQFRNLSGLPGGGHGITPEGRADFSGATALSTPVGYSLSGGERYVGFGAMSDGRSLRLPFTSREGLMGTNGTGYILSGFSTRFGRFSVGGMMLSAIGDTVLNVAWQAPIRHKCLGMSLGVQDAAGSGGSAGEGLPTDGESSRSFYWANTVQIRKGAFVTLGAGTGRFKGLFGNASFSLSPRVKLIGEYDTFGWNAMAAFSLGRAETSSSKKRLELTLVLGVIRGRNAFWALSANF